MTRLSSYLALATTCLLFANSAFAANNVGPGGGGDGSSQGSGGGGSGSDPDEDILRVPVEYLTIQAAIDAASDGDHIQVSPGTYTYSGSGDSVIDTKGKAIWIEATGSMFDPPVVINGQGVRRCIRCVQGEGNDTIIEGFRIINGHTGNKGGGAYCDSSSPYFKNCVFEGNSAYLVGGGMTNDNSSPTLVGCTFENNFGGGMFNLENSNPTLTNCTFENNSTSLYGHGGGMYSRNSTPTLIDCTFENNLAEIWGGGMFNESSDPTLTNCTFIGNSAYDYSGGGMANLHSSPALTNCTFADNSANTYGGGMSNASESSPSLTNCTFTSNSAVDGGAIYSGDAVNVPVLSGTKVCGNSLEQVVGDWDDNGGNDISLNCFYVDLSDVNADGAVDGADLAAVLGAWGSENSAADIDQDGTVNGADLALLLGAWN